MSDAVANSHASDASNAVKQCEEESIDATLACLAKQRRVWAFDADGVLLIPWTQPERCFPGTPTLLATTRALKVHTLVASFNLGVGDALERLDLRRFVHDLRVGSNVVWTWPYDRQVHRPTLSKVEQLKAMLAACCATEADLLYVDDEMKNVNLVRAAFPKALVIYAPSTRGITLAELARAYTLADAEREREEEQTRARNLRFETVVSTVNEQLGAEKPNYDVAFGTPSVALGRDTDRAHRLILEYWMDGVE